MPAFSIEKPDSIMTTSNSSYLPRGSEEVEDEDCFAVEDSVSLSASSFSQSPDNPLYVNNPDAGNASITNNSNNQTSKLTNPASTLKRSEGNIQAVTGGSSDGEDSDGSLEDSYGMREMSDAPRTTKARIGDDGATSGLPFDFHNSPEPIPKSGLSMFPPPLSPLRQHQHSDDSSSQEHRYHMLCQIQEDRVSPTTLDDLDSEVLAANTTARSNSPPISPPGSPLRRSSGSGSFQHQQYYSHQRSQNKEDPSDYFVPQYTCTKIAHAISKRVFDREDFAVATWLGFWALLNVTCANYVLTPLRDAVALHVGVQHIPKLTLASSLLAFLSSVPIGWLFEAPDPNRRKLWKKMGLTRGATQGTSLALFYRFFALSVLSYAVGFYLVDILQNNGGLEGIFGTNETTPSDNNVDVGDGAIFSSLLVLAWRSIPFWLTRLGQFMYVAFFLVVHLMKLHSISLVWGVTTEAMEYEDVARKQQQESRRQQQQHHHTHGSNGHLHYTGSTMSSLSSSMDSTAASKPTKTRTRYQRLALVGFGGTLGGVLGSLLASSMAKILDLPGLLVVSAFLLEVSAELSIELGRVMEKHWEEQQIFRSTQDLTSLDPSMKRSTSLGSMKRVASGNSLYAIQQQTMKRVASGNSINGGNALTSSKSLSELASHQHLADEATTMAKGKVIEVAAEVPDDNTFTQRLLRGISTILKSRLLMAIFTYNALFASTSVLLSFQRAVLVSNRKESTTVSADTAFLANINMASSIAVFAMQASGLGALIAQKVGPRGSLALMPVIRLAGLFSLCWWHRSTNGQPPNLILFLMLDECTRVVNLAIAKPVRESLWRGLSNEARYEAKPIVDTLANRWGAGSASFCVSVVSRFLLFLGQGNNTNDKGEPVVLGLPPVLFLGFIVAAWWVGVSFDLGHIRRRIDMELKKHQ